jgi:hypothetical protein
MLASRERDWRRLVPPEKAKDRHKSVKRPAINKVAIRSNFYRGRGRAGLPNQRKTDMRRTDAQDNAIQGILRDGLRRCKPYSALACKASAGLC